MAGVISAVFRRELQRITRYPAWIVNECFSTVLWIAPIVLMGLAWADTSGSWTDRMPSSVPYMLAGTIVWQLHGRVLYQMGYALRTEMLEGTLECVFTAPSPYLAVLAGKSIVSGALGLLQAVLLWAIGSAMFRFHGGWAALAALGTLLLFLASTSGLVIAFSGLVLQMKRPATWMNLINALIPLVGGVLIPISLLPSFLRPISYVLPTTYASDILRYVFLGTTPAMGLKFDLLVLSVMAVLGPLIGWAAFRSVYRSARVSGSLLHY